MKKLILSTLAAAIGFGAYAQGTIYVDNTANSNPSPYATSGGLLFQEEFGPPVLYSGAFSLLVLGGASASSLSPIVTLTGSTAPFNYGGGIFTDSTGSSYTVPGVAGNGIATLELKAWTGNFSSYAAAVAGGGSYGEVIFQNPTGGGGTVPPPPVDLVGMPALIMGSPEPATIVLGSLGAAALVFFRRRK